MQVYWYEQSQSDVPAHTDWLSASDAVHANGIRFAKRRDDWLLGRWTAKHALAACLQLPSSPGTLVRLEIRPEPSGAPEAYLDGRPARVGISLSHSCGVAICAVADPGVALGCDLEVIESRSDIFVRHYFTSQEQQLIAQTAPPYQPELVALLWSAKESALKALRTGLRADTYSVEVTPKPVAQLGETTQAYVNGTGASPGFRFGVNTWQPLQVRHSGGLVFEGWWLVSGGHVRTVVASPPPAPPIELRCNAKVWREPQLAER